MMAYLWMDEVHSPSLVQAGERKHFKKSQNVLFGMVIKSYLDKSSISLTREIRTSFVLSQGAAIMQ